MQQKRWNIRWVGWIGIGCVLSALSWWQQGPLWGDITLTQTLRNVLGNKPLWAIWLTETAKTPYIWGTLLLTCGLIFLHERRLQALWLPCLALLWVMLIDQGMRWFLFVPRPFQEGTVWVGSSSLPSTFALRYGALFGAVVWSNVSEYPGGWKIFIRWFAIFCLFAGAVARMVLLGHWGSQVLASYGIAFGCVCLLAWGLNERLRGPSSRGDEVRE